MSEVKKLQAGDRVRVVNYDANLEDSQYKFDGLEGTILEPWGTVGGGYLRVELDNDPHPEAAEIVWSLFQSKGILFTPEELEAA